MLRHVDDSCVSLTFDDGPDPDFTPRVLDLLDEHGCKASFFVLGQQARRHPELVRRMVAEGHSIGNHTFSHPRARPGREARDIWEVRHAQHLIEDISGCKPLWFRPPFGRLSPSMVQEAGNLGLTVVLWSRSGIDWGPFGTRRGIARRLNRTRPRDILLLHDAPRYHNHPDRMLRVLPDFLVHLRQRGLAVVSLDQYLAAQVADSAGVPAPSSRG